MALSMVGDDDGKRLRLRLVSMKTETLLEVRGNGCPLAGGREE